ncbi:MAG: hypothetical protein ACRC8S_13460 [Fimbriiglobus sp.]
MRWFSMILALAAGVASAQEPAPDVRYWPLKEINFPVPMERLSGSANKPTKLHFYVSDRGQWRKAESKAPSELEIIDTDSKRRGFRFVSPVDGRYDFALQLEYANGEFQPRDNELSPQYTIVFDTRPPLVRVARLGRTGLDWEVVDENLGPGSITIEARWIGDSKFTPVTLKNFVPKTRDSYTWSGIPANDAIEVRLVARDKANLETVSPIIRLPGDGNAPGLLPATAGSGFGNPAEFGGTNPGIGNLGGGTPNNYGQPQLVHSNTQSLKIISNKLQRVTRSGIAKSYLWMRESTQSSWTMVKSQNEKISGNAVDPIISIEHKVDKDGRYGFIIIPENGAEKRDPDPKPGDVAQFLIEVDTRPPTIEITSVAPYGNGAAGPKVEITWKADDINLTNTPITLQYSTSKDGQWKPVHEGKLPNNGRYVWEVEDKNVWKFVVRAIAEDIATNKKDFTYKEVLVDLETPKATIEKIEPYEPNGSKPKAQLQDTESRKISAEELKPTAGTNPTPGVLPNIKSDSTKIETPKVEFTPAAPMTPAKAPEPKIETPVTNPTAAPAPVTGSTTAPAPASNPTPAPVTSPAPASGPAAGPTPAPIVIPPAVSPSGPNVPVLPPK